MKLRRIKSRTKQTVSVFLDHPVCSWKPAPSFELIFRRLSHEKDFWLRLNMFHTEIDYRREHAIEKKSISFSPSLLHSFSTTAVKIPRRKHRSDVFFSAAWRRNLCCRNERKKRRRKSVIAFFLVCVSHVSDFTRRRMIFWFISARSRNVRVLARGRWRQLHHVRQSNLWRPSEQQQVFDVQ